MHRYVVATVVGLLAGCSEYNLVGDMEADRTSGEADGGPPVGEDAPDDGVPPVAGALVGDEGTVGPGGGVSAPRGGLPSPGPLWPYGKGDPGDEGGPSGGDDPPVDTGVPDAPPETETPGDSGGATVDTGWPPVDTGGTPPVDTGGTPPVDTGTVPVDTGSVPVDTGSVPVDTGSVPVDTGSTPVDTATPPVDTGSAPPVDTGSAPVDTATDPVCDTADPTCDGACDCTTAGDADCAEDACDAGCTYSRGYWGTHFEDWPVTSLTLGDRTYTDTELLDLMGTPVAGDVSISLAHQLIAVKLTFAMGTVDFEMEAVAALADAWLVDNDDGDGLPLGVGSSSPAAAEGTDLASQLSTFNAGYGDLPHCGGSTTTM